MPGLHRLAPIFRVPILGFQGSAWAKECSWHTSLEHLTVLRRLVCVRELPVPAMGWSMHGCGRGWVCAGASPGLLLVHVLEAAGSGSVQTFRSTRSRIYCLACRSCETPQCSNRGFRCDQGTNPTLVVLVGATQGTGPQRLAA